MTTLTHDEHHDFHWTPFHIGFSIFIGVAATVGLWLFTGLLMALFLI